MFCQKQKQWKKKVKTTVLRTRKVKKQTNKQKTSMSLQSTLQPYLCPRSSSNQATGNASLPSWYQHSPPCAQSMAVPCTDLLVWWLFHCWSHVQLLFLWFLQQRLKTSERSSRLWSNLPCKTAVWLQEIWIIKGADTTAVTASSPQTKNTRLDHEKWIRMLSKWGRAARNGWGRFCSEVKLLFFAAGGSCRQWRFGTVFEKEREMQLALQVWKVEDEERPVCLLCLKINQQWTVWNQIN